MDTLFTLENVSYTYTDTPVLTGVSLCIEKHDLTIITGSNGVGKTTLLKILAGLLSPTSGILHKTTQEQYAYVAQEGNTYNTSIPLSVTEFVSSPHQPSKKTESHCGYTTLIDCLTHVGLSSCQNTPMDELSGGQQQRALIARALMTDPSVLLLDEPTAGIDQYMQSQFYDLIEHFNTVHKLTTIMITHDRQRQYTFGDHVICILRPGEIDDKEIFRRQFQQKKVTLIRCP